MRLRIIGGRKTRPDPGGYKFTGRTLSAQPVSAGVYSTPIGFGLLIEPVVAPADMHRALLLAEDGGALLQE